MAKVADMTGFEFNGCTVIKRAETNKDNRAAWLCICSCGERFTATGKTIRSGGKRSCGCLRKKTAYSQGKRNTTHGDTGTRLYDIWRGMIRRCTSKSCKGYGQYGAKGIKVCEDWKTYETFRDWAHSNGYASDLSIDRIENERGYEPNNCRWTDAKTQTRNRSNTVKIEYKGELLPVAEVADILGVKLDTNIYYKIKNNKFSWGDL